MESRYGTILLVWLMLSSLTAKSEEEVEPEVEYFFSEREAVTIGLMEFVGKAGVQQDQADVIADIIADEIGRMGDVRVISKSEVFSILDVEERKRLTGCTSDECFTEVSGALGMRWMVTGNLSRIGKSFILNLKLVDVRSSIVSGRVSQRIKGDEEDLLDELPEAAHKLFDKVAERLGLQSPDRITIASRHRQSIAESPAAVTVITREQIENTHCTDVICLLRQVPEVDVRRVMPAYAVVGARALTDPYYGDKALVLVDGREINIELFGIPLWQGLPLHLEDIARIEVVRGPSSALYGPNAHSLVVAITTRKSVENTAEALLAGGEYDRNSLSLRLNQRLGNFRMHLSTSYDTASNWEEQAERERELNRVRLQVDHEWDIATSTLDLGAVFGSGMIFTSIGAAEIPHVLMGHAFLSHRTDWLQARISYSLVDTDITLNLPLIYQGITLGEFPKLLDLFSGNLDAEAQLTWSPFDGNLLIAGGNYRWFTMRSSDIEPEETHEHRLGAYLHDEQRLWEDLVLTGSLRFDYNTITPPALSPRLAAVYQLTESQLLRVAFGQAFRKPCFFNTSTFVKDVKGNPGFEGLGAFFLDNIGNRDLGNESITALEVGYRGRYLDQRLTAEADFFYNRYRNTINFRINIVSRLGVPDLTESIMRFENEGQDVDSVGGSVSLTYRINQKLRANANYTFRHSWYVSNPVDSLSSEYEQKGARIYWEPAHLLNLSVQNSDEDGLRYGLSAHARSASKETMPRNGGIFDEIIMVQSPATCFISGFASWRFPAGPAWFETGVRAYNIFNTRFRDTPAVTRTDGSLFGGELLGRRILVFIRGSI